MIKLTKPGLLENFLNLINSIYKSPTAYVILRGERQDTFLLRMEIRLDAHFLISSKERIQPYSHFK